MHIEVMLGSQDSQVYTLELPSLMVGSSSNCDIVIKAEGVSRKHLLITREGGKLFVTDQGSTNGSYINEQRLEPGRKTEFTVFFSVRLAFDVLIALHLDEAPVVAGESASSAMRNSVGTMSTAMFSTKDLQNGTERQLKQRQDLSAKRKLQGQREDKLQTRKQAKKEQGMGLATVGGLLLLGFATYYQFFMKVEDLPPAPAKVGQTAVTSKEAPKATVVAEKPSRLIPNSDLLSRQQVSSLAADLKCATNHEKYLCEKFTPAAAPRFGAVQVGTMYAVLVDGTQYLQDARDRLPPPKGEGAILQEYEKGVNLLAIGMFILKEISNDLDYSRFKDNQLTFGLFSTMLLEPELAAVFAIRPEVLAKLKSILDQRHIEAVKHAGPRAVKFLEEYLQAY